MSDSIQSEAISATNGGVTPEVAATAVAIAFMNGFGVNTKVVRRLSESAIHTSATKNDRSGAKAAIGRGGSASRKAALSSSTMKTS